MAGWSIANAARQHRKLARRAPFLAAVGSGVPKPVAARIYGIPTRTATRYIAEAL